MFLVLLRLSTNRPSAARLMDGHNAWLKKGFDDGAFLLAGSLKPGGGGAILAQGMMRDELMARLAEDPFVAEDVVRIELHEIAPGRTDDRLAFLKDLP
ncbi:hypothetical protein FG93_02180 [Bosea sp. LC85]|uniref:YciI family protein n=1 Tax=Bosea sp. LC85 TaxID=1502851 RepID=UPI0004E29052|nr:hypothetical protein [Bosea sp. LC85]KFC72729.1 hypothetical protein FG93_02180 [Bosea sp. LC85]